MFNVPSTRVNTQFDMFVIEGQRFQIYFVFDEVEKNFQVS